VPAAGQQRRALSKTYGGMPALVERLDRRIYEAARQGACVRRMTGMASASTPWMAPERFAIGSHCRRWV